MSGDSKTCYFYYSDECRAKHLCKTCITYYPLLAGMIDKPSYHLIRTQRFTEAILSNVSNYTKQRKMKFLLST